MAFVVLCMLHYKTVLKDQCVSLLHLKAHAEHSAYHKADVLYIFALTLQMFLQFPPHPSHWIKILWMLRQIGH